MSVDNMSTEEMKLHLKCDRDEYMTFEEIKRWYNFRGCEYIGKLNFESINGDSVHGGCVVDNKMRLSDFRRAVLDFQNYTGYPTIKK